MKTVFNIIKGPVVSNKAYRLNKEQQQLVIEVMPTATKKMIKDAVEVVFGVKVASVNTTLRKKISARAASKRYNATPTKSKRKIAYVALKEGYEVNFFDRAGQDSTHIEQTTHDGKASRV